MAVKLQIADTYRRDVQVTIPGDGKQPQKVTITAVFRDVDPAQMQTETETIRSAMSSLLKLVHNLKTGRAENPEQLDEAEQAIEQVKGREAKIDQVLVGIEGLELTDAEGNEVTGEALLDFVRRYPRFREPIMAKWAEENEQGDGAGLGNLMKSAGRGRG